MSSIDTVNEAGNSNSKRVFFDCNAVDGTNNTFHFTIWGDLGKFDFYLGVVDAQQLVNSWFQQVFSGNPMAPITLPLMTPNHQPTGKDIMMAGMTLAPGLFALDITADHRKSRVCVKSVEADRLQYILNQDLSVKTWSSAKM